MLVVAIGWTARLMARTTPLASQKSKHRQRDPQHLPAADAGWPSRCRLQMMAVRLRWSLPPMRANSTPYPKLSDGVNRIICSDEMRPRLEARDTFAVGGTPEDFDGFIATETSKWAKMIRDVGVKAQ